MQIYAMHYYIITHVNESWESKAFRLSVILSVCMSVCPQHNSKTNEPKVFKLGM